MPLPHYYEQVAAIENEQDELNRRLAVNREGALLVEALDFGESASEVWESRPVEWRRSILKLVRARIEVTPFRGVYAKGKNGGSQFDPERVRVEFVV